MLSVAAECVALLTYSMLASYIFSLSALRRQGVCSGNFPVQASNLCTSALAWRNLLSENSTQLMYKIKATEWA